MSKPPTVGKKAPTFSLPDANGKLWSSKDRGANHLVVYFYPRDNTPGCTQEGVDFAKLAPAFKKAGTMIIGISADTVASHAKFQAKMQFPFALLADDELNACKAFDVYREKNLYGRKYMGIERSTFLIDKSGVLRREWRKVRVKGHAEEVLAAAREL